MDPKPFPSDATSHSRPWLLHLSHADGSHRTNKDSSCPTHHLGPFPASPLPLPLASLFPALEQKPSKPFHNQQDISWHWTDPTLNRSSSQRQLIDHTTAEL